MSMRVAPSSLLLPYYRHSSGCKRRPEAPLGCRSCLYYSTVPFRFRNLMPPKTPPTQRKRKRCDSEQAESSNLSNRIRRAMHTIGVPETEARVRYARLFMCCLAMRGVSFCLVLFLFGAACVPARCASSALPQQNIVIIRRGAHSSY